MARTQTQLRRPQPLSQTSQTLQVVPMPLANHRLKQVMIGGRQYTVSPVFHWFWWFVAERHRVHQKRMADEPRPWTRDSTLEKYPFTNVFRVYDRVTQYVLHHIINKGDEGLYESCFRVILFRTFNKISTWEYLVRQLGTPYLTWNDFDVHDYEQALSDLENTGSAMYGKAYIMPAPKFGWARNYSNHLRLIKVMMDDGLPDMLHRLDPPLLKDAHGRLSLYPSMGDFMASQLLLDLNMLPHFDFNEHEWSALGPGSLDGLVKMFGPSIRSNADAAIRYLYETQMTHFARLGIPNTLIPRLCDQRAPGLSMVDLEHTLCECEKWARDKFPYIKGKRTELMRTFRPAKKRVTAELPAKWRQPSPPQMVFDEPPPVHPDARAPAYEVSHVVAEKKSAGVTSARYLVRWVGYDPVEDTWMSERELMEGAQELLAVWNGYKERIADRIQQVCSET